MCLVFNYDKNLPPLKYPFVKSIFYLSKYIIERENYNYSYINIYNRKSGSYHSRHYRHDKNGNTNFIIDKPVL